MICPLEFSTNTPGERKKKKSCTRKRQFILCVFFEKNKTKKPQVNDLLMRNADLVMETAVMLIKNGFPIAVPIGVGTNWSDFTPADNPAFGLALGGRPNQSQAHALKCL